MAPASVNVARLIYLLVCEGAGVAIALSTKGTPVEVSMTTGLVGGLIVGGFFIWVESLIKGFSLRGFSTATFGLLVGVFCAWLLTRVGISNLVGLALRPRLAVAKQLTHTSNRVGDLGHSGLNLKQRCHRHCCGYPQTRTHTQNKNKNKKTKEEGSRRIVSEK